jgi:glycerol uptake facilitator-like aquaporin
MCCFVLQQQLAASANLVFVLFYSAGINPARDLGPRIAVILAGWGTAGFTDGIVYLLAPLVGGPIGAFIADKVLYF